MITVLQGEPKAIFGHTQNDKNRKTDLVLMGTTKVALPFVLVRLLLPLLKKHLGNRIVALQFEEHKTAYHALFRKPFKTLSKEELRIQSYQLAQVKSHITHSKVAKDALIATYSKGIIQLTHNKNFRIVIPDVRHLDQGSLDVLKYVCQMFPDTAADVVIGYPLNWEGTKVIEDIGVSSYYAFDSVTILQSFIYAFEAKADVVKKIQSIQNNEVTTWPNSDLKTRLDSTYDDTLELRAYQILQTLPNPSINQEEMNCVIAGIQRCFELFDFTNTLYFSLNVLTHLGNELTHDQKAKIYHMMGLAAHNRHFFSQGNMALANFLENTFEKALSYESDTATQTAIVYRLIVTQIRRKNNFDTSKINILLAYELLDHPDLDKKDKALLGAWIDNIYSFWLMKKGKIEKAIAQHEKGYFRLLELKGTYHKIQQNEIEFTKAVLCENLATLNSIIGNFDQMEHWYAREAQFTEKWPSLNATSYAEWQSFYYQSLQLDQALQRTYKGLAETKNSFNYILEYFFTLSAGDINYRLGNTEDALLYFQKATSFHQKLTYHYVSTYVLAICIVKTLIRSQKYELAIKELETIQDAFTEHTTNSQRIETQNLYAKCMAGMQRIEDAENCINTSIAMAVADGGCDQLLNVALAAAQTCELLQKNEDAANAYQNALEVSETTVNGAIYKPDDSSMATIHLGLSNSKKTKLNHLVFAIEHLTKALKKDADSWWMIQKVLLQLQALPRLQQEAIMEHCNTSLSELKKAALQRADCKELTTLLNPIIMNS